MYVRQPVHCRPQAYEWLTSQMPVIETTDGLLQAAVAVSMHELRDVDPAEVDADLDAIVRRVRSQVRSRHPQALLAHMHDELFEEMRLHGNDGDYYDRQNSYISRVLDTRQGLPIILSLIYKVVAERLGLQAAGVGAPGHFMVSVRLPNESSRMIIDPFLRGQMFTVGEAVERMTKMMEIEDDVIIRPDDVLPLVTHRQWAARIVQNLVGVFHQEADHDNLGAMIEMRSVIELGI